MYTEKRMNFLLAHTIIFFTAIPLIALIGWLFPGEAANDLNQVPWAVWAVFGTAMAHIFSLFTFMCVIYVKEKKRREQYE